MSIESGGEKKGAQRESIENVAARKREHMERIGGPRMTQEQAVRSVRDNWMREQRRQGKE